MTKELETERVKARGERHQAYLNDAAAGVRIAKRLQNMSPSEVAHVLAFVDVLNAEWSVHGENWLRELFNSLLLQVEYEGVEYVLNRPHMALETFDSAMREFHDALDIAAGVVKRYPRHIQAIDFAKWWQDRRGDETGVEQPWEANDD